MLARELRSRPENIPVVLPAQTAPATAIVNWAVPRSWGASRWSADCLLRVPTRKNQEAWRVAVPAAQKKRAPLREEPTWGRISGSGLDCAGGPACLRALWRDRRGTPADCLVAQ
ncbi:hypothetical protein NDU88_000700 [Pleurodeles waltl]|uniref:Uncharacterized protein n=1 Tax=Pleurodeles waltl TaxID=8319 RepID=A0AAV7P4H2_PLEWA|nr:hypothetical protein NDU88_000700 [Pleurodeles waltl]